MTERERLRQALYDPAGRPVTITRLEFEPLPKSESFRWSLYSGPRRIFTTEASALEVRSAMNCTAILVESELGLPPPVSAYAERT